MKQTLTSLLLFASLSAASAAAPAATVGNNITTTVNALDLRDRPLMLQLHQGEQWQLQLPDAVAKITSGRDDQLDVQVDSNIVFIQAIKNTGWGSMTIRLENGDLVQVVYSLGSASGHQMRRVVVEYPAPTDDVIEAAVSMPTVTTAPLPAPTSAAVAPAPSQASWLNFAFISGSRAGTQLTLNYRLSNTGTEALTFNPRDLSMKAGQASLKAFVSGDQNALVRINAGQTMFGSIMVDIAGLDAQAPVTWSWVGTGLTSKNTFEVGGPLALVMANGR